jgi:uncharacterized protein (DUF952 family)
MFIYHIILPEVWEQVKDKQTYEHESLATEGFIHCSYEEQLDDVIGRYYSDADELVILKIDTGKLTSKLVSEPSTGGEIYPHIYGTLNLDAVLESQYRLRKQVA